MQRNILADRLKGYACFLVLFGHVIMGVRLAGINIPEFFWNLEKFIWSFHVALFLFLSGFVYKMTGEWKSKKTKLGFIKNKMLNLGIPYIIFSVVYILINSLVGQANNQSSISDILNIWKSPVAQYWFLYALFFLFCIWTVFSGVMKNWITTLIVVAIGYIVPYLGLSLGCFDVVFYSALAFGLGTCMHLDSFSKMSVVSKMLVLAVHIAVGVLFVAFSIIEAPFIKEMMIFIGIVASIVFISLLEKCKIIAHFLDFMNKYSFQTYLLHTIFTAGIRIVLLRLNVNNWIVHIILGTVCGLAFSVIAAEIAKKIKPLEFCFFPSKVIKSYKGKG